MLPGMHSFPPKAASGAANISVAIEDVGNVDSTSDSSYTFSINVGTGSDRVLVVGATFFHENNLFTDFSSVTVDGNAMTSVVEAQQGVESTPQKVLGAGVWVYDLSGNGVSGTVNLVINLDDTATSCGMSFLVLNGVDSTTATDSDSGTETTDTAVSTAGTVEANAAGITVGVGVVDDRSDTLSWSTLTEKADVQTGTGSSDHRHGFGYDLGSRSAATETLTASASNDALAIAMAAFE